MKVMGRLGQGPSCAAAGRATPRASRAASADRVALLSAGSLVAVGEPSTVLSASAISEVYGLAVRVVDVDGRPLVVPER